MTFHLSVLYPNAEGATFDVDYYLNTHIPKAVQNWKDNGLVSYEVVQFAPGPDGSKPPYIVGCHVTWKDAEAFQKAAAASTKEVTDDVVNFTNQKATIIAGGVIGSG
jgi:uncharacterized protein (TIGR02118 family)